MVLTDKQKAVTENDFNEKRWNACKIWKEHQSFERFCVAFHNLIKKIKETGSTECHKGSGRPITVTTEENRSIFEELVCSQFYPQFHQANRTSDIDQQIISSSLGQEKEYSLLQTFKYTSDEFSMP